MLEFVPFITTLMAVSILTGLFTEAIKKQMEELKFTCPPNLLAGIVSIVLSVLVFSGQMVHEGLTFDPDVVVYLVCLVMGSWLCSMVGFDKVKQAIDQFMVK